MSNFTPLHNRFVGVAQVSRSKPNNMNHQPYYTVDLRNGTCDCEWGAPYVQRKDKLVLNSYCAHKLKAMRSIAVQHKNDESVVLAYLKALSTRYNVWEVVSAFHKELRRGDYNASLYWGIMLMMFRGKHGLLKRMIDIVFEETRDFSLYEYLLELYVINSKGDLPLANICRGIKWFCMTPKKWEMEHRLAIFEDEMKAYKKLAEKYSYDVAKGSEIIPSEHNEVLMKALMNGIIMGDRYHVQYGLKGFYKSKSEKPLEEHKLTLFDKLQDIYVGDFNKFEYHDYTATRFRDLIINRIGILENIKYHEINAFCDLITGEPHKPGLLPPSKRKAVLSAPFKLDLSLFTIKQIPLYAQDNHTWAGKALMKRFYLQLEPGAIQRDIDFRWCGAYFGVAWRHLAIQQHGTCDVAWGDVKWPSWLYAHTRQMFY